MVKAVLISITWEGNIMSRKKKRYTDEDEEILTINWIDDTDDDVPEGCAACGGPYPNCCSSCPLFDD